MATLTIGRVGLDVGVVGSNDGVGIQGPNPDLTWEGDRLSFSGDLIATTLDQVKALRRQLAGYGPQNRDEEVVPVRWTDDSDVDGFYYVVSTEVSTIPASYNSKWFPFKVELEAVPDRYSPSTEVLVDFTNRSTTHSTAGSGSGWAGIPVPYDTYSGLVSASSSVTTYTNNTVYLYQPSLTGWNVQFSPSASNFYNGAARIEVSPDSGTNWFVVVGDQVPNLPAAVRLTNDRVRWTTTNGTGFTVGYWDGAQWDETAFLFGYYGTSFTNGGGAWAAPAVNVNSPTVASVKLSWPTKGTVDWTIRRGGPLVTGYVNGASTVWAIARTASEAATAITGGIVATSANAQGNKFLMVSASAVTQVTTNTSGIYLSSGAGVASFGVSAVTGNAPFTSTNLFWTATEQAQQIIAH